MRITVVIPTLNEAATIAGTLRRLAGQGSDEVIVVDAASPDRTAELARSEGVLVIDSPRGRGVQQNRGAAMASGENSDRASRPPQISIMRMMCCSMNFRVAATLLMRWPVRSWKLQASKIETTRS